MYAAHLYDAVFLYANALSRVIRESNKTEPEDIIEVAKNGRALFKQIIQERKYHSEDRLISSSSVRSRTDRSSHPVS